MDSLVTIRGPYSHTPGPSGDTSTESPIVTVSTLHLGPPDRGLEPRYREGNFYQGTNTPTGIPFRKVRLPSLVGAGGPSFRSHCTLLLDRRRFHSVLVISKHPSLSRVQ